MTMFPSGSLSAGAWASKRKCCWSVSALTMVRTIFWFAYTFENRIYATPTPDIVGTDATNISLTTPWSVCRLLRMLIVTSSHRSKQLLVGASEVCFVAFLFFRAIGAFCSTGRGNAKPSCLTSATGRCRSSFANRRWVLTPPVPNSSKTPDAPELSSPHTPPSSRRDLPGWPPTADARSSPRSARVWSQCAKA